MLGLHGFVRANDGDIRLRPSNGSKEEIYTEIHTLHQGYIWNSKILLVLESVETNRQYFCTRKSYALSYTHTPRANTGVRTHSKMFGHSDVKNLPYFEA